MQQTDNTCFVPGYILNKYIIMSDDKIVTQSNYHFPNDTVEVYTTGWPFDKELDTLSAIVAVWHIKPEH